MEDVTEVAQETAADESVGAPEVDVVATTSVTENESNTTVATLSITNPGENEINFEITGEDSDKVVFDSETNSIQLIDGLDHETNDTLDITLVVTDDLGNIQINDLTIEVDDVNEAPSMLSMTHNNLISVNATINDVQANGSNISETTEIGAVVADITVADPDGDTVQYTLAGAGSDNFAISNSGEITLTSELNFESQSQFTIQVVSSDGINEIVQDVVIYVVNDNEAPSVSLDNFTVAENAAAGTVLATATGLDPEGVDVTYTIAGTGSENFQIDSNGNITLIDSLDYETTQSYELTIFASDGLFTVPKVITVSITDSNEAPSVTSSVAFNSFLENTAVGTTIATSTGSDPENDTITYSLSGTGSDKFSVDADGKVTLANALDYETATSYSINLNASDGTNTTTKVLTINVGNVAELVYSGSLAASSQNETISTGSVILSSSTSGEEGTVTYSISDPDNKFAINSSTGEVTLANALDHETKTSHSFTVTANDGSNSESQTFTLQVGDVDLSISASLASAAQTEGIATGTTIIAAPTASGAEGTITYSITDADNKFTVNSSTGAVTLANALDYETKTSHSFTLTASDGTTTTSQTFTLNVTDIDLANLVTALASATLSESSSVGASVASVSSLENDTGSAATYSITAGNSAGKFSVNSSTGAITTAAAVDFKDAKSYTLTLTASAGGDTTSSTVVIPIQNNEDFLSASVRFSQAYHSVTQNGFSATATRGPSGSSMANYTLEGATNDATQNYLICGSNCGSANSASNYTQVVSQEGNNAVDIQYYFPLSTSSGARGNTFDGTVTAKIADTADSSNKIDFATSEILYGGRDTINADFWFMQLDKDETSLSIAGSIDMLILETTVDYTERLEDRAEAKGINVTDSRINWNGSGNNWPTSTSPMAAYYDTLSDFEIIWDARMADNGFASGTRQIWEGEQARIEAWAADPGSLGYAFIIERCCGRDYAKSYFTSLISDLGGSITFDSTIDVAGGSNSSLTLPTFFDAIKTHDVADSGPGYSATACTGCTLLYPKGSNRFAASYFRSQDLESGTTADIFHYTDVQVTNNSINDTLMDWFLDAMINKHGTNQIFQSFQDQFIFVGEPFTESTGTNTWANFVVSLSDGSKKVMAGVMIPVRNFTGGTEYFYPNFIPSNAWSDSFGDVGLTYDSQLGENPGATDADWQWVKDAQGSASNSAYMGIQSCRFDSNCTGGYSNEVPEGQSLFWQVYTKTDSSTRSPGVGIWAQISFKDSYDGASGSTTRDDQQSLFSVLIADYDYRKNDTDRYSAGDTNYGLDGYHYWSYQDPTNADDNSKALLYGTSPVECVTTRESGCWYTKASTRPLASLLTPSDPYSSEDMQLSVFYDANSGAFNQGTFAQASFTQKVQDRSDGSNFSWQEAGVDISAFRTSAEAGYLSSASTHNGFFSGILEFHDSGKSQLARIYSTSTLATIVFDDTNDLVQTVAPLTIASAPANNYTATWSTVDTGTMTLKYGDANNSEAKSAYISKEVFGAEIQDDGSQIDGSSGGTGNLAGAMVSYNTLEEGDSDLFHSGGNDPMPDTSYSTWGFWAMSSVDISPNSGTQNASVHLGSWVAGDVVDQSDIPTSGSASMSGAAVMKVASRYNQSGSNYDVHKYTTTADVAATFNWGVGSYSGQFDFTNFDDKNAIVANAGFTSFSINISGSGATYSGSLADTNNGWTREAVIAGALYGASGSAPDESGGRLGVSLSKSGALGTAGANDFYVAEGIYLID